MAKRRKKTSTYRRRRIGAVAGGQMPIFAGVAVGAIVGKIAASKFMATLDPKISAGVQIAAGVLLSMQKTPIVKGIGLGMIGGGAVAAGQSLKLIAGVSSYQEPVNRYELSSINGQYEGLNYLGNPQGSPELNVIGGLGNPEGSPELPTIGDNCLY